LVWTWRRERILWNNKWKLQQVWQIKRAPTHDATADNDFDTPDHYFMRKYSSWCKSCSLVRGCGYGCDVFDCWRSNLTVWKEDKFTVLPEEGIKECERRVTEWITKELPKDKTGVWGCVETRVSGHDGPLVTEEEVHMRPGQHWLCEFGDTGNDTSGEKEFNLSHHTWEDYRDTHFWLIPRSWSSSK
jgi:hypothetical protein